MAKRKEIEIVIAPPPVHMVGDGFRVHTFFPSHHFDQARMSPFYLLDYNSKFEFSPSETPRGVGVHPHKGFETVTIAYHGKVAHHDSAGNSGVIGEGDVQWMTAASGVLHKEYHEKEFSKKGGTFQMVQLWVNLPAIHKKAQPKYQPILYSEMGKYHLAENLSVINIIAGNYKGIEGPASTFTPIEMYDIRLNKNASLNLSLPVHYSTSVLIIEGEVMVNNEKVDENHLVLFQNNGTDFEISALIKSTILLLSGEPINEPIFQYGPFLMNTRQEIEEAMNELNSGKFGHLED
jgi:hypothetical protein